MISWSATEPAKRDQKNQEVVMYDYAMFEASRARYADIQREFEKARQGVEIHGVPPKVDRSLPNWVSELLHAAPFRRHDGQDASAQTHHN
jgi:hypothetical protein